MAHPESPSARLAERYGTRRTPQQARLLRAGVIALALVFVALVLWVGYAVVLATPIKATTTGYTHVSDTQIRVNFELQMKPGTAARCGLEALNANRGQVGFVTVDIEPQDERFSHHSVEITTQAPAVSGAVKSCEVR